MTLKAKLLGLAVAATMAVGISSSAFATPLYFQGFETDTSGWYGTIAQSASGTNGITAYDGSYYGTMGNDDDATGYTGYGNGGYSNFEGDGTTAPPYPGSPFSQSISVYIDVGTAAPADGGDPAFWIDMSPSLNSSDGVGCDPAACSDEHNFRLFYTGSSVGVTIDGGTAPVLTIGTTGWYTFQIDYAKGATGSDPVVNLLDIFSSNGTLLSSTPAIGDSDGSTLTSDNLAGPGYVWFPEWQDNFSGDSLAIDDVRADAIAAVPEPSTLALIAAALLGLGFIGLRRRNLGVF